MRKGVLYGVIIIILLFLLGTVYVVDETEQAVVTFQQPQRGFSSGGR